MRNIISGILAIAIVAMVWPVLCVACVVADALLKAAGFLWPRVQELREAVGQ